MSCVTVGFEGSLNLVMHSEGRVFHDTSSASYAICWAQHILHWCLLVVAPTLFIILLAVPLTCRYAISRILGLLQGIFENTVFEKKIFFVFKFLLWYMVYRYLLVIFNNAILRFCFYSFCMDVSGLHDSISTPVFLCISPSVVSVSCLPLVSHRSWTAPYHRASMLLFIALNGCSFVCSCVNNVHIHLISFVFLYFFHSNYLNIAVVFFFAGYAILSCSTFGTWGSSVKLLFPCSGLFISKVIVEYR